MSNAKFTVGDTFKVIETGITGQVIRVREESMYGHYYDTWYTVLWDTLSRKGEYPASEADDLWEKTSDKVTTLAFGAGHILRDTPVKCEHDWKVYHGLTESFEFCGHCNQKKDA